MDSASSVLQAVDLRFGGPTRPSGPPALADFLGPPRRALDLPTLRIWPEHVGAEPGQWSVLFVPEGLLSIPELERIVADVFPTRSRPARIATQMSVVALWIPLGLIPSAAQAASGPSPAQDVAREPDEPTRAEPSASAAPSSAPAEVPDSSSPDISESDHAETPAEQPPDSPTTESPGKPDPPDALVNAAWQGVVGQDVRLQFKDGTSVQGRVGAVQDETFTLIDTDAGGVVRVLPKASVASLRVGHEPVEIPKNSGIGLLVGGAVVTAVGIPLAVTGLVMLGLAPSAFYVHLPLLLSGGAGIAAGIPMIVHGSRRQRVFKAAVAGHRVAVLPRAGSRRQIVWTGGLRFAF